MLKNAAKSHGKGGPAMKNGRVLLTIVCLLSMILGFTTASYAGKEDRPRRKGHILVKYRDGAQPRIKDRGKKIRQAYRANLRKMLRNGKITVEELKDLRGRTEEMICRELVASGAVEFAEPDYLVAPELIPTDEKFASQWHHAKMNSPAAWDITTGDGQVIVAVCDTGVEATHPDLAANMMLPGFNTVDGSTNTAPVAGHGTATAGCLAAIGNNAIGVAGMGWNFRILPVRVSNTADGYAYYSDLAEAVMWAADHGARVINVSYGAGGSSTMDSAAKYARNKGALVCISAGNSGVEVTYPDYASFLLVGASDANDLKASWSNFGTALDIVAPGTSIYTTKTGAAYGSFSGTSFSSPIAAGLAALVFALNPQLTPAEVENLILANCVDLGTAGEDKTFGRGRINAGATLQAARQLQPNLPPVALFDATPYSGYAPLETEVNALNSYDNDGSIVKFEWDFGDGTTALGQNAQHLYGKTGTYTVKLTVTDDRGDASVKTDMIEVLPDPSIVAAPQLTSGTCTGSLQVTLNWADNSNNESGFYVERQRCAAGGAPGTAYERIAQVTANTKSFVDTVTIATLFRYRIQAFNTEYGTVSAYSNEITVRTKK